MMAQPLSGCPGNPCFVLRDGTIVPLKVDGNVPWIDENLWNRAFSLSREQARKETGVSLLNNGSILLEREGLTMRGFLEKGNDDSAFVGKRTVLPSSPASSGEERGRDAIDPADQDDATLHIQDGAL